MCHLSNHRGVASAENQQRKKLFLATQLVAMLSATITPALADPVPVIEHGLPPTVIPTYLERGTPQFSYPTGSPDQGGGGGGGGGGGIGGNGGGGGGGGPDGGGDALALLMSRDFGQGAIDAAKALGVNPSALAATCQVESNCRNTPAGSDSSASGPFQMIDSTYKQDIAGALAYDPSIADKITQGLAGKMDPVTESYAAAFELRTDATRLQNEGIDNPTVLDTRAIYQFGAGAGPAVAQAKDSDNLESYIRLTPAQLAANGLTSSTTVGQWRETIRSKLGLTADQVVLSN